MDAERPERVLVLADDPEVLPVAVDAEDVAERAGADQLLQLLDTGVVEEQVTRHADEVALLREADEIIHLLAAHRRRLLDEHVLARLEGLSSEAVVGRDRVETTTATTSGSASTSPISAVTRACGYRAEEAVRTPSSESQIQARSASWSKLRARFGPQ